MTGYYSSVAAYIKAHKIISTIVAIVVVGIVFYGYKKATATTVQTQYVLSAVQKSTIVASVDGTGQVAAARELEINPQGSGAVTAVYVKDGDQVTTGEKLMQINNTSAYNSYLSSQNSLKSAELSLEKIQNPDQVTALQTADSLTEAEQNVTADQSSVSKAYDDGYSSVATAFLDIPGVINDLNNMLIDTNTLDAQYYRNLPTGSDYLNKSGTDVGTAQTLYYQNLTDYKNISRTSATTSVENLISETKNTAQAVSGAASDVSSYVDYIISLNSSNSPTSNAITTDKNTVTTDLSKINNDLSSLTSAVNTISSSERALVSDQASVNEKQTLANEGGVSSYDLQSAQLSVSQAQANLANAAATLANYTVTAPFDGTVAKVNDLVGDQSGSDAITLVTNQETATISLNEIDAAKVKVGDKATMTFDALPDITLTGTVGNVDTIGTVSQGVVNYTVTIVFDTQDSDIKPGMSVSASIITDAETDVLIVSSAAIKTDTQGSYVQEVAPGSTATSTQGVTTTQALLDVAVTTGISDDTNTEILTGLSEGDKVISQTITGTAKTTAASASAISLLGGGARSGATGGGFTGGGATRTTTR